MNLDSLPSMDPKRRNRVLVSTAGAVVLVVGTFALFNGPDSGQTKVGANGIAQSPSESVVAQLEENVTRTTLPPLDPDDGQDPEIDGFVELPTPDVAPADEGAEPDYETIAIPADQFTTVYPSAATGLSTAAESRAGQLGADLVRAQITGEGRDRFSTYFYDDVDPNLPYAMGFTVDFTYAAVTAANPNLVRTVVIWHGQSPDGLVVFTQVRIANYFNLNADGSYTPIRTDDLPESIRASDSLLNGVSITA